ncbi:MAG: aldo/keto reductase [Devosia sp.]
MLETRPVGHTSLTLTSLGLGCASIGNLGQAVSDADADAVLHRAWQAGIRYFDTAPHYGRGRSEQRLGRFLSQQERSAYVVSTKVGRVLRPGAQLPEAEGFVDPLSNDVHYDYTAAGFEESLAGSLARMGTGRADIVFVHDIGTFAHGPRNDRQFADLMSSGLPYLARLKAEGRIGAYGLGVNESAICVRVLREASLDVILLAGRWTLLDREAEAELVPLCRERGTSLVLGGIFNSGILATGAVPGALFNYAPADATKLKRVQELQRLAEEAGVELPHAALQFGLTRPGVASVLVGTASVAQLEQNVRNAAAALPREAAERLFG